MESIPRESTFTANVLNSFNTLCKINKGIALFIFGFIVQKLKLKFANVEVFICIVNAIKTASLIYNHFHSNPGKQQNIFCMQKRFLKVKSVDFFLVGLICIAYSRQHLTCNIIIVCPPTRVVCNANLCLSKKVSKGLCRHSCFSTHLLWKTEITIIHQCHGFPPPDFTSRGIRMDI